MTNGKGRAFVKGYNLDEKSSLFSFLSNTPLEKIIKEDCTIDFKHFSMNEFTKANIIKVQGNIIEVKTREAFSDLNCFPGDHVVINLNTDDFYVVTGNLETIHTFNPLEATIEVNKVERMKNLRKFERFYVSLAAEVSQKGIISNTFAIVKNISIGSVKINSREDVEINDMLDLSVKLDKSNKVNFRGRVVRKNIVGDYYEYGIEIKEISDVNSKNLHRFINDLKFG